MLTREDIQYVPLPSDKEALHSMVNKLLLAANINLALWGVDNAKSQKAFEKELRKGERRIITIPREEVPAIFADILPNTKEIIATEVIRSSVRVTSGSEILIDGIQIDDDGKVRIRDKDRLSEKTVFGEEPRHTVIRLIQEESGGLLDISPERFIFLPEPASEQPDIRLRRSHNYPGFITNARRNRFLLQLTLEEYKKSVFLQNPFLPPGTRGFIEEDHDAEPHKTNYVYWRQK